MEEVVWFRLLRLCFNARIFLLALTPRYFTIYGPFHQNLTFTYFNDWFQYFPKQLWFSFKCSTLNFWHLFISIWANFKQTAVINVKLIRFMRRLHYPNSCLGKLSNTSCLNEWMNKSVSYPIAFQSFGTMFLLLPEAVGALALVEDVGCELPAFWSHECNGHGFTGSTHRDSLNWWTQSLTGHTHHTHHTTTRHDFISWVRSIHGALMTCQQAPTPHSTALFVML